MRFLFLSSFAFSLLLSTAKAETITIGCATRCDIFFRYALRRVASINGVQVRVKDISAEGPDVQWEKYDGIIFPGGADINPKYYLSQVEPELQEYTKGLDRFVKYTKEGERRDPVEFDLLRAYFSLDSLKTMPVLGVCRGMQMLAVSQGIPLYVDIKEELGIRNRRYLYDRIQPDAGDTLMNRLFPHSFLGFKRHHQGIRVSYFQEHSDRWPNLRITAHSNKGFIAESLEFSDRPVLGVQFHPENDFGFERNRIFGWLLKMAREHKLKRRNVNLISSGP